MLTVSAAPAVTPGEDTGVMVDALVLDHAGNPVAGLNRGDGGGIWDLLGRLSQGVRLIPGRKVVILASVDQSTDPQEPSGSSAWTFDQGSFRNAILSFNAANATVYSLDLAGGDRGLYDPSLGAERPNDPLAGFDWYETRGSRRETDRFGGGLGALSAATRGVYFRSQVGFVKALTAVGRQNHIWYQIWWSPPDAGSEAGGRELAVRVRGRDDIQVLMRPVFFAGQLPAERVFP